MTQDNDNKEVKKDELGNIPSLTCQDCGKDHKSDKEIDGLGSVCDWCFIQYTAG